METVENDNLFIDSGGSWAVRKYKLLEYYANMFATSMKKRWDMRVYIDLYSSCGYSNIKGTDKIVLTSPLIAANVEDKFDKYIYCELDQEKLNSLEKRVKRDFSFINADYIPGDVNNSIDQILESLPNFSKECTVITLCLVDPFKIDNFSFKTLIALSKYKMDFLILIPSYMDVNRNEKNYIKEESNLVTKFIDKSEWRNYWIEAKKDGRTFGTFIVKAFNERMKEEGFLGLNDNEFILIRNPENNSPLYHLSFYSKSELGKKFWNDAIKGTTNQFEMNFQ